uniref:PH domain-containing protein n=1 Tax=Hucho hucho TaxID=62062 RepID=A0A4W5M158_9TELE
MFWRMSDQLAFETLYVASLRGKAKTYAVGECIFFLLLSSDTVLDIGQRAFLAPSLGVCWLTSATVAMGDVISTHLDEAKREMITAHTRQVTVEFGHVYKQQYAVALFNSVRFEIEGGGGPQSQLLHRKDPLEDRSIFSGVLFQYLEENKRWRNRFVFVADTYNISFYQNKVVRVVG